jgi:hypothetical protein
MDYFYYWGSGCNCILAVSSVITIQQPLYQILPSCCDTDIDMDMGMDMDMQCPICHWWKIPKRSLLVKTVIFDM